MDHDFDTGRFDPDPVHTSPGEIPATTRTARRKPRPAGRPEIADPLGDFSEQTGAWF